MHIFGTVKKSVSVVIRTYNEAEHIGQLIQTLRAQSEYSQNLETIIVDSGSTDSTIDIIKNYNIKPISITRKEFNYSKALNLGIKHGNGELIIILSAHAIPCKNDWLRKMVQNFEDENVAGVYCRQVPWPDANLIEVLRVEKTFDEKSKIFSSNEFSGAMKFSNAASCIRRSVWEKHPFVTMPAAEDREWSKWAVEHGYKIIYDAESKVYHCHNESCRKAAQRVIELEKSTDIKNGRRRSVFLTIKQSMGWLIRDIRQVFSSTYSKDKRVKHSIECIARSFWFILDFNRQN